MTRLVYVRHGESNTTVARVIGGPRTCSGLSPLGVQQAERLRDRWLRHPEFVPDVVIASQFHAGPSDRRDRRCGRSAAPS